MRFEIRDRDGAARVGRFETPHGTVTTPALLPVLNPNLELFPAPELADRFGAQMVITNSYIIRQEDDLRERALDEGVHGLLGWDGPVMTDSGTFQWYVYGDVDVEPDEIVDFQRDIGSDVGTILDVFSTPDRTREQAADDVDETLRRGRDADARKGEMGLALPVQGSVHPDLRTRCARGYEGLGDVHPVGGVVPLMEAQRYADLVDVTVAAKRGLDPSKPVHLFGAGHPMMFPLAALMGCDLMDSASYAKFAKDDRLLTPTGTLRLGDVTELPCPCPTCTAWTPHELRDLPHDERARHLAAHNLHVSFAEVRRVRDAVRNGTLRELVERRARAHPRLMDGLHALAPHADWFERHEALSGPSALFVTGPETVDRPVVQRFRRRLLERFPHDGRDVVLLPPARKPWSRTYAHLLDEVADLPVVPAVESFLGPVPLALDGVWPVSQSEAPEALGRTIREDLADLRASLAKAWGVQVHEVEDADDVRAVAGNPLGTPRDLLLERARAVVAYQLGPDAVAPLLDGDVTFETSPRTGRIRTVHADGDHVLSLRPRDGLFTLKAAGARRLHDALPAPRLRVAVQEDSVPFNRDGKSVFCHFVDDLDGALRPDDECLVVGPDDELVACGRLQLAPHEVEAFGHGQAVRVREGLPE